jgi:hypothetical protein
MQPHELLELLRGHGYQIAVIARIGPLLANQTNQQIMALFHGPGTIDHIDLLATVAKPDHAQSA